MQTKLQPVWMWNATVSGYGVFPIDMLRYDACVPRNKWDASAIEQAFEDFTYQRKWKSVNVQGHGHAGPTGERWRSFGWTVTYLDFTSK